MGSIISFLSLSLIFFYSFAHIFIFVYTVHAGCLYVTDTLSTPTITEPPTMECQNLLIPCQIECMCGQKRPWFIVPSEWPSNMWYKTSPLPMGTSNDQQKSCFLLSLPVLPQLANSVTMATAPPLRSWWQLHQMSLPGIEPGTFCTQVRRLNHSAKLSPSDSSPILDLSC